MLSSVMRMSRNSHCTTRRDPAGASDGTLARPSSATSSGSASRGTSGVSRGQGAAASDARGRGASMAGSAAGGLPGRKSVAGAPPANAIGATFASTSSVEPTRCSAMADSPGRYGSAKKALIASEAPRKSGGSPPAALADTDAPLCGDMLLPAGGLRAAAEPRSRAAASWRRGGVPPPSRSASASP